MIKMKSEIDWIKDTKFIPENGEINILDARVMIMDINDFKSFRDNILRIAGPVGNHLIYLGAKKHASEYVTYMIEKSRIAKIASKMGGGKKFILEEVAQILTQFGYGKVKIEHIGDEEIVGSLENSLIGVQYQNSDVPVCNHIAGLVAGGVTAIYGRDYDCEEVECIAKGDPVCRFVVKPKEEIN